MPLPTAKRHRTILLWLGAPLTLVCACLPQDDLASYSRAWTSEPEAILPVLPEPAGDGGALPAGGDAGAATSPPSSGPGSPAGDAAAPLADAGEALDAGADAAEISDSSAPAAPEAPPLFADGGVSSEAGP